MAQLYKLLFGRSKKRMYPIMIDIKRKCENYRDARKPNTTGFHEIVMADPEDTVWRQKSATVGGNKCERVDRVGKDGKTMGRPGYISKHGFQEHT